MLSTLPDRRALAFPDPAAVRAIGASMEMRGDVANVLALELSETGEGLSAGEAVHFRYLSDGWRHVAGLLLAVEVPADVPRVQRELESYLGPHTHLEKRTLAIAASSALLHLRRLRQGY